MSPWDDVAGQDLTPAEAARTAPGTRLRAELRALSDLLVTEPRAPWSVLRVSTVLLIREAETLGTAEDISELLRTLFLDLAGGEPIDTGDYAHQLTLLADRLNG